VSGGRRPVQPAFLSPRDAMNHQPPNPQQGFARAHSEDDRDVYSHPTRLCGHANCAIVSGRASNLQFRPRRWYT
jgi:hypothetical protein